MDLNDYTLVELRQIAKERGHKNVSKLKKEELLDLLNDNLKQNEEKMKETHSKKTENLQENEKIDEERSEEFSSLGYKLTNNDDKIA